MQKASEKGKLRSAETIFDAMRSMRRPSVSPILIALISSLAACASVRPILAPTPHLHAGGHEAVQRDIGECRSQTQAARPVTIQPPLPPIGAVGPSTSGIVIGTVAPPHRFWESVDVYRTALARCLTERGHQVVGWE